MRSKLILFVVLGAVLAAEAPALADVSVTLGGSVVGHIRIGGYRHRRVRRYYRPAVYVSPAPTYYYSPPPSAPAPCDCSCSNSCYAPAPAIAEEAVIRREPRPARFGLGGYLSSSHIGESEDENGTGDGGGLFARYRFSSVELELAVGGNEYTKLDRREGKVGLALLVPLWKGFFSPYLLIGGGGMKAETQADKRDFWYAEAGGGLALNFSRRFALSGDVRWSARREIEKQDDSAPRISAPMTTVGTGTETKPLEERGLEGRLTAIVYF